MTMLRQQLMRWKTQTAQSLMWAGHKTMLKLVEEAALERPLPNRRHR